MRSLLREERSEGTALALVDVHKRFGSVRAVENFSLEVAEGELLSLVGPSGCGKSTVLRLVAGLLPIDRGEIRVGGQVVAGPGAWRPPDQRSVGIVFQDYALFPHLTVRQNVAFGLHRRPRSQRGARVDEVLSLVGLRGHADRYPHELSGGEQQRVALARALAPSPAVLLLDEPFSNLDPNLRTQVRAETIAVLRQAGATAVFVTHDQQEALAVGVRVAVMRSGRLEQVAPPETVFHAPANRFVASFTGEVDFLPAQRRNGQLVTELGTVALPSGHLPSGDTEVMVRPHELALRPEPGGDAQVVAEEFQGAFVLYTVRLSSGRLVRSLQPHTVGLPPGTPVVAELAHGHAPTVLVDGETIAADDAFRVDVGAGRVDHMAQR
ncbi:MAG: ABC transporter ATP-binding protein [Actinomycetota bacterium]|nr:ABC transporter ATP-binding protein [Actinomycetota bacterium]